MTEAKRSSETEEVLLGLSRAEANIEKQEDEVKHARLEVKLREMVLEVVAPTVERAVRMQNHCDHLSARIESQHGILTMMAKDVHRAMDQLGLVHEFKKQLDDFWGSQKDLELKLANHVREVLSNVEQCNHDCKTLTSTTERLSKQIIRAQQDSDQLRTDIFKMQTSLDMGVKKNKEYLDSETKRLELSIDQVKEMHKALSDEIWGPEEVTDFSPPSLRRLDMQTRQLEKTIKEVLAELRELRLLDAHVKRVTEIQEGHGVQLTELTDTSNEISQRVNQVNKDLKAEIKRTANLMSAYSANLLHEVRSSFSNEVKELAGLHQDVQVFLKETEASLHSLQESLHSSGRHVEASLREVRLDIESLDSKRKRDKIGLEESITGLQQQASHSSMSASQLGQTLEHLSSILGISLQGQRMIIALGVQDFVDRKDTTYVGLKKGHTGGLKLGPRLDLDSFTDLPGMNPDEDEQLQKRCRYLATAFGFGQGCCVNVYLSAGGYLGDKFDDKYFFVLMCAAVYVTPLLIFALARRLDPYFDRHFGFRSVYQVRLAISMLVGALLVAGLIAATLGTGDQKAAVLALGAAVGCVAGSVASASAQFFGVISPKLVPLFFLGQTASGAYINVAARLASFKPDCSDGSVIWYYSSGILVA
ncbi:USP domain-containing protein, partial [Durusdinium trenchii]